MPKQIRLYISEETADELIAGAGTTLWGSDFSYSPLIQKGNAKRCMFNVGESKNMLDFFFRADGAVTLLPIGSNLDNANRLKEEITSRCYAKSSHNVSCSLKGIEDKTFESLLDYLSKNDNIQKISETSHEKPKRTAYKFKSSFGDSVMLTRYNNKNILLQGKPAYVCAEITYFLTLQTNIAEKTITDAHNEMYKSNVSVSEVRQQLRERIPNAYDKLDDTILKTMSPSISLLNSGIEVEEYSCYVFPVLKGLEAVLLKLLLDKSIDVNPARYDLGKIFHKNHDGTATMTPRYKKNIGDTEYITYLERIYAFFNGNRHKYFHMNQVVILTSKIESKEEANALLNETFALINGVHSIL